MSKHTPGPWNVNFETGEVLSEAAVIGTIYGAWTEHLNDPISEECKANARLIAAAPELLEACKSALGYRKQTHHGTDKCIAILTGVIAKAEGDE